MRAGRRLGCCRASHFPPSVRRWRRFSDARRRRARVATVGDGLVVQPSTIVDAGMGLFAARRAAGASTSRCTTARCPRRGVAPPVLTHMASREGVVVDGLKVRSSDAAAGAANSAPSSARANAGSSPTSDASWCANGDRAVEEIFVFYGRRGRLACA